MQGTGSPTLATPIDNPKTMLLFHTNRKFQVFWVMWNEKNGHW